MVAAKIGHFLSLQERCYPLRKLQSIAFNLNEHLKVQTVSLLALQSTHLLCINIRQRVHFQVTCVRNKRAFAS